MPSTVWKDPFPTIGKLAKEIGAKWRGYELAAKTTVEAEDKLRSALHKSAGKDRLLNADVSLVLCGSFARREMMAASDYDWTLLVDGVVDNNHATLARTIQSAMLKAELSVPGSSGTFGSISFSHDLVHRIGGAEDSNANLTRRVLMLLESRPFSLSGSDSADPVWSNVVGNILERYFEEDVHFAPGRRRVPRFLLNDLTRYWRTICVDYAAKHREQDGRKWAIRNAKLRFSRKLIFASGLAFCLSCQLDPPKSDHLELFDGTHDLDAGPFIERAKAFARTPALEYLAAFVDAFVKGAAKRKRVIELIFGTYNWWLLTMANPRKRVVFERLDHSEVAACKDFQALRKKSADFAEGLELLFLNHDRSQEQDAVAQLTLQYIGF